MRLVPWLLLGSFLATACGSSSGDDAAGDDDVAPTPDAGGDQPADSFTLVSTDVEIAPGEEITYCYYDTIDVGRDVGIKHWSSTMTPGSHHLILYQIDSSSHDDGELSTDCDVGVSAGGAGVWTYSAGTPEAEFAMPADVGMSIKAGQKVAVQMHYFNATEAPITAHVEVTGEYYAEGTVFTPAAAFITFAGDISVPAGVGSEGSVTHSCDVPDGATFFLMSTHAHRRAVATRVRDLGDSEMVFESDDWEHPGAKAWDSSPYFTFDGKLEYHCEYVNDLPNEVNTGDSAPANEMCMAVGYFFPATDSVLCYNDFVVPI